ncbi:Short chain dehydrogenase citE [Sparassis crispa]|uniref:Short chain dehydrogenase citE n=1 Tax=Sparassis crispa TaxID=139825 RepID=A0A401H5J6_9APHY|nr:Short chain dehydrogenase citE [Sparassis crispa]GBE89718.1 Short chain dehydrogenase citE [Sparassis crispa]
MSSYPSIVFCAMSESTMPSGEPPDFTLDPHTGLTFVPTVRHDTYPAIDISKANLVGKVVLVTGASKGIGKGIAIAFAKAGVSSLVLVARSNMTALETECLTAQRPGQSLKVLALSGFDTTDPTQVADAAKKVKETFGRLDILVNNAGLVEPLHLVADSDPAEWWKVWEVNIRGTYNVTRAFLPLLIECGGDKTIINMSSFSAHLIVPTCSAYLTSKLAILRLTELVALEYGSQGVIAYAVHPGSIPTDITASIGEKYQEVVVDTLASATDTLVWLVKERRDWLSGRYVSCQWDVEELLAKKQEIVAGDKLKVRMMV